MVDTRTVTARELALVDGAYVAALPTYAKRITLRFELNKQHNKAMWGKAAASRAWGYTDAREVVVDADRQECRGLCLFDLWEVLNGSVTPAWEAKKIPAQLSPRTFRGHLVKTVVHELYHVLQGWRIGKDFALTVAKENLAAGPTPGEHGNGPLEAETRDFVTRWADRNADDMHTGKFDFLVPMGVVRGLFPDQPRAFD